MSKSLDNYNKKRAKILECASELFFSNGYEGTSMDAVALKSCVTKQTVYRYFSTKSELFSAVLEQLNTESGGYVFGHLGVLEELIRFGENYIRTKYSEKNLSLYRMMITERNEFSEALSGMSIMDKNLVEYFADKLSLSLAEESAEIFCSMLTAFRTQIIMGQQNVPDDYEIRRYAEKCAEIFVNGSLGL